MGREMEVPKRSIRTALIPVQVSNSIAKSAIFFSIKGANYLKPDFESLQIGN